MNKNKRRIKGIKKGVDLRFVLMGVCAIEDYFIDMGEGVEIWLVEWKVMGFL